MIGKEHQLTARIPPAHSTSLSSYLPQPHDGKLGTERLYNLPEATEPVKCQSLELHIPTHTPASTEGDIQRELSREPPSLPKV